jgi:serine/threonine-protein kinase
MGSVWLADHLALETEVVVKFMHQALGEDPANRDRFSREAVAASRVKSPHVVQTFDHGVTPEGIPFIVMEKLDGEDLAKRIEKGPLTPRELAPILAQVCKALSRAHSADVVHRDIKPDNIFLCDVGTDEPFVKLLDFGIAKTALNPKLDNKTRTGAMMGTPYYMSPEQFAGKKEIDFRTDLWSLGVVAFECMTGTRPFDAETIGGLAIAVHSGDLPAPSSRRHDLAPVDAWFTKACCREPAGRHQSAREFAESFAAVAGAVHVSAMLASSIIATGSSPDVGPLSATSPHLAEQNQAAAPAATALLMTTGASAAIEPSPPPPPVKSRVPLYAAAGALAVVALGGLTVLTRNNTAPAVAAPVTAEPPNAQPAIAPPSPSEPAVQLAALPSASASAPAALPAETAPAAVSAAPAPGRPAKSPAIVPAATHAAAPQAAPAHTAAAAAAPKAAVNCNPPFTIDGAGVKHPKLECL